MEPMLARLNKKIDLKVSYRNGDYRASLSALRIGELADSGETSAGFMYLIPSMTTADLSISKNVELGGNKGRVKFVVKNIADERAPLADGYNGYSQTFTLIWVEITILI